MRLNLLHVSGEFMGYGRLGNHLHAALERAGVDIYDDLPDGSGGEMMLYIAPGRRSAVCAHAAWVSTPGHARGWWEGQSRSILTMWESNLLPEPFREGMDEFDLVIVPSLQNLELFSDYHPNVKYVPLGVEPADWFPIERPTLKEPFFTFLTSGGGMRKGSALVIEAFRKVFETWPQDMPIPRLVVQVRKADVKPSDDRIHMITGRLEDEEERALYGMSHVYVQPSYGEGFGLRPLQAIAQGMPTIATDAHGHKAFSHLMTHPIGATLQKTPPGSFHHGPAGSWWEPNFDELCAAMEDAYLNYEHWLPIAHDYGQRAIEDFNWDICAERYLDALGRDRLELPDVKPEKWVSSSGFRRSYLVRVSTARMMEVGGIQYRLEPGRDYWEPADVKRVLFESGSLDISCLPQNIDHDTDMGLTPEQVARIPEYTGAHALCPTCAQRLNSNRPTLEELERIPMPVER